MSPLKDLLWCKRSPVQSCGNKSRKHFPLQFIYICWKTYHCFYGGLVKFTWPPSSSLDSQKAAFHGFQVVQRCFQGYLEVRVFIVMQINKAHCWSTVSWISQIRWLMVPSALDMKQAETLRGDESRYTVMQPCNLIIAILIIPLFVWHVKLHVWVKSTALSVHPNLGFFKL